MNMGETDQFGVYCEPCSSSTHLHSPHVCWITHFQYTQLWRNVI